MPTHVRTSRCKCRGLIRHSRASWAIRSSPAESSISLTALSTRASMCVPTSRRSRNSSKTSNRCSTVCPSVRRSLSSGEPRTSKKALRLWQGGGFDSGRSVTLATHLMQSVFRSATRRRGAENGQCCGLAAAVTEKRIGLNRALDASPMAIECRRGVPKRRDARRYLVRVGVQATDRRR